MATERADFLEFLASQTLNLSKRQYLQADCTQVSNTVLAAAGIVVVFWRTRRLAELHYENLARRIGLQVVARRGWRG